MNIDCITDCIARYEIIAQGLAEEVIRLKSMACSCENRDSARQAALLLAAKLDDQTEKIKSVVEHMKKYCNDNKTAEQEIITQIKKKLFVNDACSLLGKVIIEKDIKKTQGSVLCNHELIHDQWLDNMIIKNIAEGFDV